MMRAGLLWLSEQRGVFDFVRGNPLARRFASRFVAGEHVDEAIRAADELRQRGITVSLDLLGESVHQAAEAEAASVQYAAMVEAMAVRGLEVNVSVKLTQLGFDLDADLCERNVRAILEVAVRHGGFVRLDMEGSAYTQRTLDFFRARLFPAYGPHCGVVIQSMLRRSDADIEALIQLGARVRLCKGAYLEPPEIAYPDKRDVDDAYRRQMKRLMLDGRYPGLATHDEALVDAACAFAAQHRLPEERFEFQLLYGVRRDLQRRLRGQGRRVRVYLPFGTQWYPYLMRRLAERPANIAFILGSVVKEALPGA